MIGTSGQDGVIGRHTLPPCTTKTRTTTNLRTKTNQNCQKIKLYRSLTSKELQKKHSPKLVRGAEMSSQGREDSWARQQLADQADAHLHVDEAEGTLGE